jgi:tetratricopeptide (TPR) repeat protein
MNYTTALSLNPQYAEAYNNRAYVYMRQQNYGPALQDLDQALRLRPDYIHALMNRADIHNFYFAQDKRKAIADYDKILALGDTTGSVCEHRAVAIYGLRGRGGWNAITYLQLMQKTPEQVCAMQE